MTLSNGRVDRGGRWSVWLRWGGTALSVLLLIWLLTRQGWSEIIGNVRAVSAPVLGAAALLMFCVHFWNVARWQSLYEAQEIQCSYREALKLMFAAVFASNFLPTTIGGDVLRVVGISNRSRGRVVGAATVVADRLIGMLGMTFILPLSWPIVQALIQDPSIVVGAVAPFGSVRKLLQRAWERFDATVAPWVNKPRTVVSALLRAWLGIASYLTAVWLIARDMGVDVTYLEVAGATSLTYFIALIPLSINGYGLRELGIVAVYTTLGASADQSAALALITRTLMWIATLPGVLWVGTAIKGLSSEEPDMASSGKPDL